MEAKYFSEIYVEFQWAIRHYIAEHRTLLMILISVFKIDTLKMGAAIFSEMLVTAHETTRHCNP
jgi:hypothetical protein